MIKAPSNSSSISSDPSTPPLPQSMVESTAQKVGKIFYLVLSIIVFPVGLVRLIGYIIHQITLHKALLPISGKPSDEEQMNLNAIRAHLSKLNNVESFTMLSPYNESLKGLFLTGNEHPKKVVLIAGGNMEYAENSLFRIDQTLNSDLGVSLCSFNPAGVADSEGSVSLESLDLNVYTALHHLISEKKILPENIVVYGASIGGMQVCRGVQLFEEMHPEMKINIVHERSFADLQTELKEATSSLVSPCLGGLAGFLGWLADLTTNCKESFDQLRGRKLVIHHPGDRIIPFPASLVKAIQDDNRYKIVEERTTDLKIMTLNEQDLFSPPTRPDFFHNRRFNDQEKAVVLEEIASMLDIPYIPTKSDELQKSIFIAREDGVVFEIPPPSQGVPPTLEHYTFTPLASNA